MIRTYPLEHRINKGKQQKILAVLQEYRKLAMKLSALQWVEFYRSQGFQKNLDIKNVSTLLSERYKQTCQYQVVGVLHSFIANRQNEFTRMVCRSSLDERTKKELLYINEHCLWFSREMQIPENLQLAERNSQDEIENFKKNQEKHCERMLETFRLARAIFKHILSKHKRPSMRHLNLALDSKVAKVHVREKSKRKKASHFDYWITFSTLEPFHPIYLPLKRNRYFDSKKGKLKKFCQINVDKEGNLSVCLILDVEKRPYAALGEKDAHSDKIALDFGLRNLFTSDHGDLWGRNFIDVLKKYDHYITSLSRNRQRQGLPIKSRRYGLLVSHLRNFLKNEIHRVINKIVAVYHPQEIVVENLHFISPDLSRSFNRLLSNMGRGIIQKKWDSLAEEFQIVVIKVPSPYTSQQCSLCGYVDAQNRKSQSQFICCHCNAKIHADVNAARNIFDRSSNKDLSDIYSKKQDILRTLMLQFLKRYPSYPCEQYERNPYFKNCKLEIPEYG